ncbi:hypothetical protein BASA60_005185 [Batrachochytrium salamandrivorans]|nr:hypothetical protein BASA60_005185 [Batrachochytrium salamandrivorans]
MAQVPIEHCPTSSSSSSSSTEGQHQASSEKNIHTKTSFIAPQHHQSIPKHTAKSTDCHPSNSSPVVASHSLPRRHSTDNMLSLSSVSVRSVASASVTALPADLDLVKLIFLTICLAGVQFTWTVELAYGTPYLLSLGLAKSLTALVWIAGPLSGLLIQPIVGVYSDRSTFRFGRRRPFILVGGLLVVMSIVMIAYSRELAQMVVTTRGSESDEQIRNATILVAVVAFYFLDFSINAVQASCRALIVDISPLHQQDLANAWGGRMIGLGNVLGYFVGYLDLPSLFPILGPTQLKILCVIAIAWFTLTLLVTCFTIVERPYRQCESEQHQVWWRPLADIIQALFSLPRPIQSICNVQFLAWLGWFPFLFYSTSWISDRLEYGNYLANHLVGPSLSADDGTRAGSFALLLFAIISVVTGFILPMMTKRSHGGDRFGRVISTSHGVEGTYGRSWGAYFTLPRIWGFSLFAFAILMVMTVVVHEVVMATFIIAATGVSWGVAQWVPFTLMGEFVSFYDSDSASKESDLDAADHDPFHGSLEIEGGGVCVGTQVIHRDGYTAVDGGEDGSRGCASLAGIRLNRGSSDPCSPIEARLLNRREDSSDTMQKRAAGFQAGMVLGIHNIYIVLPQFLSTLLSAIVFAIITHVQQKSMQSVLHQGAGLTDPPMGAYDPFGWILRLGAVALVAAGVMSLQIEQVTLRPRLD